MTYGANWKLQENVVKVSGYKQHSCLLYHELENGGYFSVIKPVSLYKVKLWIIWVISRKV